MEIWKDVEGYEGLYQVSNLGNVRSLNYRRKGVTHNLSPKTDRYGYSCVKLCRSKSEKMIRIHRLVAIAFIPNPNGYRVVNHKDENKHNNNLNNLEWCTHQYNIKYSLDLHPQPIKKPYKYSKRVKQIDINTGEVVREYESVSAIKHRINKNTCGIRECCLGKRKTAYGYKWEFCE